MGAQTHLELKVAQLAGFVAEQSAYHHGENSLCLTIVGMAQDFVGSNNVNLLLPIGQFGTRLGGGKDAASSRYIFTRLSPITRHLFPAEDDAILDYLVEEGKSIEPNHYLPILPMVLINASSGIGTGWSSTIPSWNPREVAENVKRRIQSEPLLDIQPWYNGFKGRVQKISESKYQVTGLLERIDDKTLHVTELPIGCWTDDFKAFLIKQIDAGIIKSFQEHHTESKVSFIINVAPASSIVEQKGKHQGSTMVQ